MYIVSAGHAFNDIDAFGCAIAYAELLRLQGHNAQAVFIGPLNHSVTALALAQNADWLSTYTPQADDKLIYVDLSDPKHFAFPNLAASSIVEIYDHHYGFEDYWQTRLRQNSHIERVGAAATLIWEEFIKRDLASKISASSANLLALAILQNTLNFTSSETNARDTQAFAELQPHIDLPSNWQQRYFDECAVELQTNFATTLRTDTKIVDGLINGKHLVFSQLEITADPTTFLAAYRTQIDEYWATIPSSQHLINVADIASKTSLLYSDDAAWLQATIKPLFTHIIAESTNSIIIPIHQRKQILKLLQ